MTAPLTRYQRKNDRGHLQPHPNGAWVKWAEVEARLAALQRERDEAVNQVATYAAQALDLTERLEHAQAQVAWQPIETAPTFRKIIVWCGYLQIVTWHGTLFFDEGAEVALIKPTHWMPLPDAPRQLEEARR